MIIKRVYVRNFRNIKEAELEFSEGCNVFYGQNAQGKTNMLEAISVCLGSSFRGARAASFVPFIKGANNNTQIMLTLELDNLENKLNTVKYEIDNNGKATIVYNGIALKNAYDLYGELKYVVFIPDDLDLIKGIPELRRNYIDNIAILQNKTHKKIMSDYKEALNQRNALNYQLSMNSNMRSLVIDMVDVWNDALVKQGLNITYGRLKYYDYLKKYALNLYSEITDGIEKLNITYQSNVFGDIEYIGDVDFSDKKRLYDLYLDKLITAPYNNAGDFKTRIGAHRDDIRFTVNEHNMREFGSQGQLRSAALVMKLSEAETIRDYNRERPVILLDEVLGELDENRRKFVVKHFDKSQVFITSCNFHDFQNAENIKIWQVDNGDFKLYSSGQ